MDPSPATPRWNLERPSSPANPGNQNPNSRTRNEALLLEFVQSWF